MQIPMTYNRYVRIATGGAIGYHIAPGTLATFCALPLFYGIAKINMPIWLYATGVLLLQVVGWYIIKQAITCFADADPCEIVLDEMLAVAFVVIGLPADVYLFLVGCIFFRIFDIYKPLGISYFERLSGATGIMLDDIVAALYANALLHLWLYFSC